MTDATHEVFISFSQKDKATADAACAMLEANGVRCWIAPRDIPYGQNWGEGILAGINRSRVMVLIFSSNANESHHVHREVERAVNRGMPVLPFRIENVSPGRGLEYFLSLPNWLDAFTPPLEPYLQTLVTSVKALLKRPDADVKPPAPVAPPPPPGPSPFRDRRVMAGVALGVLLLAGAVAWSVFPSPPTVSPPPSPPPVDAQHGSKESAVSFAEINTRVPGFQVAAAPYLHKAPIAISVEDVEPAASHIVFVNNLGLYEGKAVEPTLSQTFLTQMDTGNVPASFTLKFSEPVASVSFVVPKVWAASESGITFPAWRAVALSADGVELSSASLGLVRRFADVPAQTYTLSAPGFDGIAAVKFSSDPRLDGKPFAAFSAILIEQITLTRP